MTVLEVARAIHILAGATALLIFWLPLVAKKGGPLHRRVGWVYSVCMDVVEVTAWIVCGSRLLFEGPSVATVRSFC